MLSLCDHDDKRYFSNFHFPYVFEVHRTDGLTWHKQVQIQAGISNDAPFSIYHFSNILGLRDMTIEKISFTDLIASSIHDMKNSVNIQVNTLEKMAFEAQERGDSDAFKSLVGVIAQAYRVNANLIQLLSLYKFGKAIYPLDIAEQSVSDVINEALLQTRSMLDFKGISVEVDCAPACYWYFDRDLITGVLLNAVNNAFNYTKDRIRIAASIDSGCLFLRIEDNGRGYPKNMLHSEGITTNKSVNFCSGSTGLGFYFSSQVAQLHQNNGQCGALTIENGGAYGGGCFVVKLP